MPGSWRDPGAAFTGVCLAGIGFTGAAQVPASTPELGSGGDQRGLLLTMKTAPVPCEPAAPWTLPGGMAVRSPNLWYRREGTWGRLG